MKLQLHNIFPILLLATSLALTGCFEKKKEEVVETPSSGGGGSVTPPSNNYGYVTLSYPSVSGTYQTGSNATSFPETFAVSNINGASLTTFTISPSLPFGLSLDPNTGTISGTVYGTWSNQNYTISAQKPDNEGAVNATVNFGITQNATPVDNSYEYSDLRYSAAEVVLIVGQPMTPLTLTYNGPQDITFFNSNGSNFQPMWNELGLNFDNATGTITGTPTNPTNGRVFVVYNGSGLEGAVNIIIVEGPPTNLAYTNENATYPVGHAITQNTPSASGGNIASFSVSPALPAGLSLDTTTGFITGTPTAVTGSSTYTITATNIAGSGTKQITITVANSAPASLTYVNVSSRYTVGASITANTPIVTGGGAATSFSVNPALPDGLSLNTSTGVISGLPITVTATASYTVTASNAAGSANKVIGINVVNPGPHTLYAATGSEIKAYSVDITNGDPVYVGKIISSSVSSKLIFHPTLDCAFGYSGGSLHAYSINKLDNGSLSDINSAGGLSGPVGFDILSSGDFIFVANNANPSTQFVARYSVNPTTCAVALLGTTSVFDSTIITTKDMTVSGNHIYVLNSAASIRHFSVNGSGDLSLDQTISLPIHSNPGSAQQVLGEGISIRANGGYIYANDTYHALQSFSIDGSGNLATAHTNVDGNLYYRTNHKMVVDPINNYIFSLIQGAFSIDGIGTTNLAGNGSTGTSAMITGTDIMTGYAGANSLGFHTSESGTYVYTAFAYTGKSGTVRLKLNGGGSLTPLGTGLVGNISGY